MPPADLPDLLDRLRAVPVDELARALADLHARREIPAGASADDAYDRLRRRVAVEHAPSPELPRSSRPLACVTVRVGLDGGLLTVRNGAPVTTAYRVVAVELPAGVTVGGTPVDLWLDPGAEEVVALDVVAEAGVEVQGAVHVIGAGGVEAVAWLAPGSGGEPATVEVGGTEARVLRLLTAIQTACLTHPVAAQAAYSGLVAEGRRFAETDAGKVWKARLAGSELVRRARLVFEASTLWLLQEDPRGALPGAYVDAVFMAAAREDLELLLDSLARGRGER